MVQHLYSILDIFPFGADKYLYLFDFHDFYEIGLLCAKFYVST